MLSGKHFFTATVLALVCAQGAHARVAPDQAARLGRDLTPFGAEKAGSADGSIPAWEGGLTQPPACFKGPGTRYCDPFPQDKPVLTITSANAEQYKARLTPGQRALFARFADYRMNVYPTRRTAAYPKFIEEATARNALNAELVSNGEGLGEAAAGVPFPVPTNAVEVIWNHKVRYRGPAIVRWNVQAPVLASGGYALSKMHEDVLFSYGQRGAAPRDLNNKIIYFAQVQTEPARQAGTVMLVHEAMDQVKEPRAAWMYYPGQRRLRRAPNVAYDNPGNGSDGLRTNDQLDMFNGAMDRYSWKLVGKREMYVPANAYRIHSDAVRYSDILKKGHINQDLVRYELRRVWVVDSFLKPGVGHIYKRRTFYVDEDSWYIVAVDAYDSHDLLWRVQEGHPFMAYDIPAEQVALETCYDLLGNRYLALAMNNEEPEIQVKAFDLSHFAPGNVPALAAVKK